MGDSSFHRAYDGREEDAPPMASRDFEGLREAQPSLPQLHPILLALFVFPCPLSCFPCVFLCPPDSTHCPCPDRETDRRLRGPAQEHFPGILESLSFLTHCACPTSPLAPTVCSLLQPSPPSSAMSPASTVAVERPQPSFYRLRTLLSETTLRFRVRTV